MSAHRPYQLVQRHGVLLRGDPRRVIAQLFLPGQEVLIEGESRAIPVLERIQRMSEDEAMEALLRTHARFGLRHRDLDSILMTNFRRVEHRCHEPEALTPVRRLLIGAYFTREYSIEAAALFNPSIVVHPDQSGLGDGELRFVLTVRGVGEGHISSIGFREGVIAADGGVVVNLPGLSATAGDSTAYSLYRDNVMWQLEELGGHGENERFVLGLLPEHFTYQQLEQALSVLDSDRLIYRDVDQSMARLRWVTQCNYAVEFPAETRLAERVLYPTSPTESHGMEDARFVHFTDDDGHSTYYGTYTAFDGQHVVPQMIQTSDFLNFRISQLSGSSAKNKGLALFPRKVNGQFVALSRWDRESNDLVYSENARHWDRGITVQAPEQPWELIQLGNCGSPIETEAGWLVLTHGVGPMRLYGIGAMLLDLDDPSRVIGKLQEPLLTPDEHEREGYVPNVVYTCGALAHGDTLVMPYGCSDATVRIATVDLPSLLAQLREGAAVG